MSEDGKIANPCRSCKEYTRLFGAYIKDLTTGDYNCWQGMGIGIGNVTEEVSSMNQDIIKALVSICKGCDNGPGICSISKEKWSKMMKRWEGIDTELRGMPSEESERYLRENSDEIVLKCIIRDSVKDAEEIT